AVITTSCCCGSAVVCRPSQQGCFCICPTFGCLRLCRCYQGRCCRIFNCEGCDCGHCVATRIATRESYFYTSCVATSCYKVCMVVIICPCYRCTRVNCFISTMVYQPVVQFLFCMCSILVRS